jgi:L-alanine-DL-glutamate epimerase-like enolase superfamily enzyme
MTAEQIVDASKPYIDQGCLGVKLKVGKSNPEADAERVAQVRELLGEDVWLGVDANQRYDYATALSMGEFFQGEIGADWFEEPISCEDVDGHARLCRKLDIPIALGETLGSRDEFQRYLERDAVDVLQPDVTRVGGITNWLKIAQLGEIYHRKLAPHVLPEIGVHLACGLPSVMAVEYMPWLYPAFLNPPAIVKGQIVPPQGPGLGLRLDPAAVDKYRVAI